ncbi:hypothetical protein [Thermus filiformis]|uniref:Uncharacterized protein n=1 Tax=Thermus filiformis TaxID=276 RepID=A0A0D6XC22_THEFI|nr:hypothetical protein [Thermus filiformis]KIX84433.1 hypothetical protein THFILI_11460 [Thermus filiformis]
MRRVYPAHKVTPLLTQDPELMALWKEAAQEGRLKAETRNRTNVVIVEDPALIARLEALGLPGEAE